MSKKRMKIFMIKISGSVICCCAMCLLKTSWLDLMKLSCSSRFSGLIEFRSAMRFFCSSGWWCSHTSSCFQLGVCLRLEYPRWSLVFQDHSPGDLSSLGRLIWIFFATWQPTPKRGRSFQAFSQLRLGSHTVTSPKFYWRKFIRPAQISG